MRSNLVIRIQKLFRRSDYIPEGADTSDEQWDDLPYGGPGLRAGAAASPADRETEREWTDLLSWDQAAAQVRAAANPSPSPAAGVAPTDDEQEWAAALARAKRPTLIGTGTPTIAVAKAAPAAPARTAAQERSLRQLGAADDDAEWSQRLARAKARAESDRGKTTEEEAEWRSLIARAKARPSLRPDRGNGAKAMGWMRAGAKAGAIG
jgi:hypothetical protein